MNTRQVYEDCNRIEKMAYQMYRNASAMAFDHNGSYTSKRVLMDSLRNMNLAIERVMGFVIECEATKEWAVCHHE